MSASCLYSPTTGAGQAEGRMNARGLFSCEDFDLRSTCPPVPESHPIHPLAHPQRSKASHRSTWPLRRLFLCVRALQRSCSERAKNIWKGRGEAGQDVEGSPGLSRRTRGHSSTCAPPDTDSCRPCVRLEGPLRQRPSEKKGLLVIF